MTKPFDAAGLQDFLDDQDRKTNPFFVGREELQNRIAIKSKIISRQYLERSRSNPAGGETQVIKGAPGIGKTSLLAKFKQNCIDQLNDESEDYKTIPIYIPHPDYLAIDLLRECIKETRHELNKKITLESTRQKTVDALQMFSSASALRLNVGVHQSNPVKIIVPKKCTILLMIDEVQSISPDPGTEIAKMIFNLDSGSCGYPIFPVLAGLSNSTGVLQQIGITRFGRDAEHQLQPLSLSEIKESIEKFMDHFYLRTTPKLTSEWGDRIGSWVDGWPKHLEDTMRVLGEELLTTEGDLSEVDPHKVKLRATKRRIAYYNSCFGAFGTIPKIVGAIMADIGPKPRELVDILANIFKLLEKPQWSQITPNSTLPPLNYEFLLHHGLIDSIPENPAIFECPIPSLQSYAVAWTGSPLHVSAYAGDLESLGKDLATGYEINGVDDWGRTPLHLAAEYNWDQVVQILLGKGADPQIQDNRKRLPLDMAKEGSATHDLINKATIPSPSPQNSKDYDYDFDPSPDF